MEFNWNLLIQHVEVENVKVLHTEAHLHYQGSGEEKTSVNHFIFFIIECHLVPSNRKINNLYLMPITSLNKQEHGSYVLYWC